MIARLLMSAVAALVLAGNTIPTGIHNLGAVDRTHLFSVDGFSALRSVDAIPVAVRAAFARGVKDSAFAMADPREKYQATDVIRERGLPRRRLIFGACSIDHCLLHYEKGGRGHSYHVVLFKVTDHEALVSWRATSSDALPSVEAVRAAIKEDRLDDWTTFAW